MSENKKNDADKKVVGEKTVEENAVDEKAADETAVAEKAEDEKSVRKADKKAKKSEKAAAKPIDEKEMGARLRAKLRSWFTKDKVLLYLLSLLVAIILWVAIISYVDPDTTIVVSDVPVQISMSSPDAVSLSILSGKVDDVDVEVTAPRSKVPSISVESLTAEIDLTGEVKPGTYVKQIEIKTNSEFVKVKSVNPSQTEIVLDVTVTKTLPIDVDDGGFIAPHDYYVASPTLSSDTVKICGPKAVVDSITKAVVKAIIPKDSKGIIDFKDCEVGFVDRNSAPVSKDTLKVDVEKVTVSIPVIRRKTVPLRLELGASQSMTNDFCRITYSIGDETFTKLEDIDIAVVDDLYDQVNEIVTGTLDFTKIHEKVYTEEFDLEMPTGVTNISGISTIGVTVKFGRITTDSIAITSENISLSGVPEGKSAEIASKSLRFTVCGSETAVNAAKKAGVTASVSLEGAVTGGAREYPVTIKFGDLKNIWVYVPEGSSPPSVNIEIK